MTNTKSNIIKFAICFIAAICLFSAMCVTVFAADDTTGDVRWSYNTSTNTLTISGTGAMANYSSSDIPKWITSYKSSIKYAVIESGVTNVGNYAFADCTNLQSVTLASTVTTIGNYAFRNCAALKNITLPTNTTTIGTAAFYSTSISSIEIPKNVTYIGSFAFANNYNLTTVRYNAVSNEKSGSKEGPIFSNCPYISSVTIGNTVKLIPSYTFALLSGISSVTVPETVTDIGEYAFGGCTNLTVINFNAKSCERAGSATYPAFSGCKKVITINVGENVKIIPAYVFETLSQITSITLPDGATEIGEYAFYGCTLLEKVNLSEKVSVISKMAFGKCTSFTGFDSTPLLLSEIGERAFYECTSLKQLELYETVSRIGANAFEGTSVKLKVVKDSYAYLYGTVYGINMDVTEKSSGGTVVTPTVVVTQNYAYLDGKIIIKAKFDKALTTECVHVAFYNSKGEVVEYMIVPLMGDNNNNAYIVTKDIPSAVRAKLLVWDSIKTAKPISEAVDITITRP